VVRVTAGLVHEIATEALVDAIVTTGRRLGGSVLRGRRSAEESAIIRWFDTYRLVEEAPELPELPDLPSPEVLRGDEVQAVLHELLAVRLTDAPEADVARVREAFALTLGSGEAASALFDHYDGEICALVARLENADLLRQVRAEALSARVIAVLHAIERHTAALEARPDRRTDEEWLARYRRHLAEHHGLIDPPDFDRRRRVPIADLYVPPTIVPIAETDPDRPQEIDLWTLDEEIDRTVLLGDPGAGKTTTANVLTHHHATGDRVPFLVTLREFAAQDPPAWSVAGFVEHRLERFYQCPAPPGLVDRLLLSGRALVIFDGLDELVDTSRRADVTAIIERFCTEYPLARVLVTSRQIGYDQARLDDRMFSRYRIDRFTDDRVAEYVRKWFAQEPDVSPDEAERWAESFLEESTAVPDLRANPLMLALMCILYRGEGSLPRDRAEVYEQCAKLLFHKWDARRRIRLDLRAGHLLEPTLRHLAYWLFTREGEPAVTERELVEETSTVLRDHDFGPEAAEEFVEFCRGRMWVFSDVGTTANGRPLYAFTHRTFMEYFAAAHLAYTADTPEELASRVLAPHVARHEWDVVGELAVQIKDRTSRSGAERVYRLFLADPRRRSIEARGAILEFLARSLRSVSPTPATVRALTEQILDHFFAGDLDAEVHFLPLSWLLAGCQADPKAVDEVISARVAEMIGSSDPGTHLNGLRLAILLQYGAAVQKDGPGLSSSSPARRYWKDRARAHAREYSADIAAAAVTDGALLQEAVGLGLLTRAQALETPDGLRHVLRESRFGMFNSWWVSIPNQLADPDLGVDVAWLEAIGEYLSFHPDPPFVRGPVDGWSEFVRDSTKSTRDIDLRPAGYLGAAACLLISSETAAFGSLSAGDPFFGPLGDLTPYIAHRFGFEPLPYELPELPVPERFQNLFETWANGCVDFVGSAQVSSEGGVV
jgi:hypothetical protein